MANNRSVPPAPTYPPSNTARGARTRNSTRNTKVEINKVSFVPDLPSLPPLTFSFNKTVIQGGGGGGRTSPRDTPGSGFSSDEDIRAYCESVRKDSRPRAVLRSMDAEALEAVLRQIPDVQGSMGASRARARRVTRHLRRIAAAEKLIAKQAGAMWATFTREYEAQLPQVSSGRPRSEPRHYQRGRSSSTWKQL